ncbi:MAG: PilZ domain-containing protein [Bermanella sp.]
MDSMKEQRQFVRKALHCTVSVFNKDAQNVGILVDYSDQGIMISSSLPIEINKEWHFTIIDIPNNIGQKRSGSLVVQSKWCDKISNTQYGTGFQLIKSDDKAQVMLRSYDTEKNT